MNARSCLPLLMSAIMCVATASFGQTTTPAHDELGMAQELGPATWARCAPYLANPSAKSYELSYVCSNTMPLSPFVGPYEVTYRQTGAHARLTTAQARCGQSAPIITTAILLDAKAHVGKGSRMKAGEVVTAEHIEDMLKTQGLEARGIRPGDVVYIYTGWSEHYQDPDIDKVYYSMAPGLSSDAAKYLGDKRIVAVGLDTPFIDPIADGQLVGKAAPPAGTLPGMPFPNHHYLLTQAGAYLLENIKLDELAKDGVSTSCTMILPLLEKGASGSPIRPIAIGAPKG